MTHTPAARRFTLLAVLAGFAAGGAWLADSRGASAQGATARHRMTKITETIYRADNPGTIGINSTSWVFINDDDVLAVDSEGSPDAARSLMAGIATVTSKPLRYLVDSHFHIDHAYGNAALPSTVQIIGSDFTRRMMQSPEARQGVTFRNFGVDPYPARIDNMKRQLAAEADAARKATLTQQIAVQEATRDFYAGNFPLKAPNVTLTDTLSIWSGTKEFRIMFLGRAHTGGDVFVYVPSEKAVANGDTLFKATVGWQGDAFPNEHPATLDNLKELDIELLLPGHGDHVQGKANIDAVIVNMQNYLREEWRQVAEAKTGGATPDAALQKLDLSRFREAYGNGATPSLAAVRRIYNIIDGRAAQ
jgi:cyclase